MAFNKSRLRTQFILALFSKETIVYFSIMRSDPLAPFYKDFEEIGRSLRQCMSVEHPLIQEILEYMVFSGGKRIRPVLVVACARMFGLEGDDVYKLSVVPEYLHAASLLHDDVVDEGELRRGKFPAYKVWGNKVVILSGDYLYARAIEIASSFGVPKIDSLIARTVQRMAEGEIIQLVLSKDMDITRDGYYSIIERKTSALIAASCGIGSILAGAPKENVEALLRFGACIGKAFQIVDDLLDYTGLESEFGKGIGTDLKEGKITLPLIHAFKHLNGAKRKRLRSILGGEGPSKEDIIWVKEILKKSGALDASFQEAKGLIDEALSELYSLPGCETTEHLSVLSRYILERRR